MATAERPSKKKSSIKGRRKGQKYDNPSFSAEDEEVDETFVALQNLLDALNRSSRSTSISSNSGSVVTGTSNAPSGSCSASESAAQQQRMSREELLESRRQERDRFRRSLFTKSSSTSSVYNSRRRRTCPAYYCSEEEEDEDVQAPSVESTISNRFMNGSFSTLNVHVISRSRWSTEDRVVERLPIVMLPKSGQCAIPTDNEKIRVVHTDEYIDLRENLVARLPPGASLVHYLTPPRSTWYMQMHDFEALQC